MAILLIYFGNFLLQTFFGLSPSILYYSEDAAEYTQIVLGWFTPDHNQNEHLQNVFYYFFIVVKIFAALFHYLKYGLMLSIVETIRIIWGAHKPEILTMSFQEVIR